MKRYEDQFDALTILFDLQLYLYPGFLVAFIFLLSIFTTDNITLFQNKKGRLSLMPSHSQLELFPLYNSVAQNLFHCRPISIEYAILGTVLRVYSPRLYVSRSEMQTLLTTPRTCADALRGNVGGKVMPPMGIKYTPTLIRI